MPVLFKDNISPVKSSGQSVMLAFMGAGGYTFEIQNEKVTQTDRFDFVTPAKAGVQRYR